MNILEALIEVQNGKRAYYVLMGERFYLQKITCTMGNSKWIEIRINGVSISQDDLTQIYEVE